MGDTIPALHKIAFDLRYSWYFRVWAALWFICFVFTWVALGILGHKSDLANEHLLQQYYTTREDQISFPNFQLRIGIPTNMEFTSFGCTINEGHIVSLTKQSCNSGEWCFRISASEFEACRDQSYKSTTCNNRLMCRISVNDTSVTSMIGWELENEDNFGDNAYASIWIAPNDAAWVLITKQIRDGKEGWDRQLLYHSRQATGGEWVIVTIINSFDVDHYFPLDLYSGWQSVADIGGFAFFLYILHSICMIFAGIWMVNNSSFLSATKVERESSPYQNVDRVDHS